MHTSVLTVNHYYYISTKTNIGGRQWTSTFNSHVSVSLSFFLSLSQVFVIFVTPQPFFPPYPCSALLPIPFRSSAFGFFQLGVLLPCGWKETEKERGKCWKKEARAEAEKDGTDNILEIMKRILSWPKASIRERWRKRKEKSKEGERTTEIRERGNKKQLAKIREDGVLHGCWMANLFQHDCDVSKEWWVEYWVLR